MTKHQSFDDFVDTIAALRAPGGCPWDQEQTHQSIAQNMIEEAYEAVDAIEAEDVAHMREELGDVLLQVVLQSQIAADEGEFTIDDVCNDVNEKIIRRHPHVFGEATAGDASEVLKTWDAIKLKEQEQAQAAKAEKGPERLLSSVPVSFPALIQAQKISRKAAAAGFEWESVDDVWVKVDEEIAEVKEAYSRAVKHSDGTIDKAADPQGAEDVILECGDVLFTLVNVIRKMGVNAEEALRHVCNKFRQRWAYMEDAAYAKGQRLQDVGLDAQEQLWNEAKEAHREAGN